MKNLSDGIYALDSSHHLDGPFELIEAIEFLQNFAENGSPEMGRTVLVKKEGNHFKIGKYHGDSFFNVDFLLWEKERAEFLSNSVTWH